MTYELAKELKEAGFPQGCLPIYCDLCFKAQYNDEGIDQCDCLMKLLKKYDYEDPPQEERDTLTHTYIPTLSELIEACGKELRLMQSVENTDEWKVEGRTKGSFICASLEEAVAHLYLALKRKPDRPLNTERE